MRIKLSGYYEPTTFKWSPEVQQSLTDGIVNVPLRATMYAENGLLHFNIWTYGPITSGEDPAKYKNVWVDKFKMADGEPAASTWKDMSGGVWKGLTWVGEYISWEQKCCEFHIHWTGNFASVDAMWPHKRYNVRGEYKQMYWEGTLIYLDDKSLRLVEELYNNYYERK